MSFEVIRLIVTDRTEDRVLVSDLSMPRQQFADIKTGDVGGDWRERPTNIRRGVRLHVIRFQMRRPTMHEQQNHGGIFIFGKTVRRGRSSQPKQVGERQTTKS